MDALKAILVAVDDNSNSDFEYMLDEMENLIEACDMEPSVRSVQTLPNPNPGTYVGKGKLDEIQTIIDMLDITHVVFADTLTPAQLKNVTDILNVTVLDRTGLILEIFSKRAGTREARLQVESANLHYMLPRLIGMRANLGRQGGASGSMSNKGQGEKQLELDRRHIERKIKELDRELEAIEHDRQVQRGARDRSNLPSVALVGYTNAGKSTLMNHMISLSGGADEKQVMEKDMLFATLDTTVRKIATGDKKDFLLSDTVGFVSNLPHSLIKAFRSTLDEARYADLLLIVLDASDSHMDEQKQVTEDTLRELDCIDIPRIYVMNKCDRLDIYPGNEKRDDDVVYISAKTGLHMEDLLDRIKSIVYSGNEKIDVTIPYSEGTLVSLISENCNVLTTEYLPEGTHIIADAPKWISGQKRIQELNVLYNEVKEDWWD